MRDWLLKREVEAFDICDYVMYPVAQAREPYENASAIYKDKFSEINDKFFYVPTALNDITRIEANHHVLDSYNIPQSALRLCYIGRHSEVKGFPFLKEVARRVWNNSPDIYFIIGGKEYPIKGIEDKRWIELGWVNTPSLLNEVDAFILPNKETYFDLILLEVLRQGTPVILSRTGGNKWFEDKGLIGLKFFEYGNEEELFLRIKEIQQMKLDGELENVKQQNREFCQKEFNMKLYVERYIENVKQRIMA